MGKQLKATTKLSVSHAITGVFRSRKSGRKRSVKSFENGKKYVYDSGKLGKPIPDPRGGTYKPVIRKAGWKLR